MLGDLRLVNVLSFNLCSLIVDPEFSQIVHNKSLAFIVLRDDQVKHPRLSIFHRLEYDRQELA